MLNKLCQFIHRYEMLQPGDHVVCAVSGGADSVSLLFAMFLLRDKLKITLSAAHYNHGLRGDESVRDENFVRELCDRLDIPLIVECGVVKPGKKGLEAAAREARYSFLMSLEGKIATAHTANDNFETVLMHLVRGTGLKGLGGIAPVNGRLIRPMLEVTKEEVLSFLGEYNLTFVTDSTNGEDAFLRNRLRLHVIPLLEQENPNLALSASRLAQRLRQDEIVLQEQANLYDPTDIKTLQKLPPALRSRAIYSFLQMNGVAEPESSHILAMEKLVFSDRPSARLHFQNGIYITRNYGRLECCKDQWKLDVTELLVPGNTFIPEMNLKICCRTATGLIDEIDCFTVVPVGKMCVRHKVPGDELRLRGGKKKLKKLFIDMKIPLDMRRQIPVIVDDVGVIAVYGVGVNRDRLSYSDGAIEIRFVYDEKKEENLE